MILKLNVKCDASNGVGYSKNIVRKDLKNEISLSNSKIKTAYDN